jgi:recombination protein RecR
MQSGLPSLDLLVHELCCLPGIGEKTAQRLAQYILKRREDYPDRLRAALEQVKERVQTCQQCCAYTEEAELCSICQNTKRNPSSICIVEDPSDIFKIEAVNAFNGYYHVLNGSLSPLDGVHPEDLNIEELFQRIEKSLIGDNPVKEVIFALDADLEGDTTALYLSKHLAKYPVRITRIAHGVPFGSDIDFIDRRTLGRAIENRVEL